MSLKLFTFTYERIEEDGGNRGTVVVLAEDKNKALDYARFIDDALVQHDLSNTLECTEREIDFPGVVACECDYW